MQIHAHTHVHTRACVCACARACARARVHMCIFTCVHVDHACTCTHVHARVHMCMHVHVCMHVHSPPPLCMVHTHMHTHTRVHTRVHTCTCMHITMHPLTHVHVCSTPPPHHLPLSISRWRCSRARALPHHKWRVDTFKRVAETTGPRLANVVGKSRLSLTGFLPEVQKLILKPPFRGSKFGTFLPRAIAAGKIATVCSYRRTLFWTEMRLGG